MCFRPVHVLLIIGVMVVRMDNQFADTSKNISRVLFLTLSNLMFVPSIALAISMAYTHFFLPHKDRLKTKLEEDTQINLPLIVRNKTGHLLFYVGIACAQCMRLNEMEGEFFLKKMIKSCLFCNSLCLDRTTEQQFESTLENSAIPTVVIVNQGIALPIDNTSLSSSNTDSSKKSTDNLLN